MPAPLTIHHGQNSFINDSNVPEVANNCSTKNGGYGAIAAFVPGCLSDRCVPFAASQDSSFSVC
jgi:hypothetical protein